MDNRYDTTAPTYSEAISYLLEQNLIVDGDEPKYRDDGLWIPSIKDLPEYALNSSMKSLQINMLQIWSAAYRNWAKRFNRKQDLYKLKFADLGIVFIEDEKYEGKVYRSNLIPLVNNAIRDRQTGDGEPYHALSTDKHASFLPVLSLHGFYSKDFETGTHDVMSPLDKNAIAFTSFPSDAVKSKSAPRTNPQVKFGVTKTGTETEGYKPITWSQASLNTHTDYGHAMFISKSGKVLRCTPCMIRVDIDDPTGLKEKLDELAYLTGVEYSYKIINKSPEKEGRCHLEFILYQGEFVLNVDKPTETEVIIAEVTAILYDFLNGDPRAANRRMQEGYYRGWNMLDCNDRRDVVINGKDGWVPGYESAQALKSLLQAGGIWNEKVACYARERLQGMPHADSRKRCAEESRAAYLTGIKESAQRGLDFMKNYGVDYHRALEWARDNGTTMEGAFYSFSEQGAVPVLVLTDTECAKRGVNRKGLTSKHNTVTVPIPQGVFCCWNWHDLLAEPSKNDSDELLEARKKFMKSLRDARSNELSQDGEIPIEKKRKIPRTVDELDEQGTERVREYLLSKSKESGSFVGKLDINDVVPVGRRDNTMFWVVSVMYSLTGNTDLCRKIVSRMQFEEDGSMDIPGTLEKMLTRAAANIERKTATPVSKTKNKEDTESESSHANGSCSSTSTSSPMLPMEEWRKTAKGRSVVRLARAGGLATYNSIGYEGMAARGRTGALHGHSHWMVITKVQLDCLLEASFSAPAVRVKRTWAEIFKFTQSSAMYKRLILAARSRLMIEASDDEYDWEHSKKTCMSSMASLRRNVHRFFTDETFECGLFTSLLGLVAQNTGKLVGSIPDDIVKYARGLMSKLEREAIQLRLYKHDEFYQRWNEIVLELEGLVSDYDEFDTQVVDTAIHVMKDTIGDPIIDKSDWDDWDDTEYNTLEAYGNLVASYLLMTGLSLDDKGIHAAVDRLVSVAPPEHKACMGVLVTLRDSNEQGLEASVRSSYSKLNKAVPKEPVVLHVYDNQDDYHAYSNDIGDSSRLHYTDKYPYTEKTDMAGFRELVFDDTKIREADDYTSVNHCVDTFFVQDYADSAALRFMAKYGKHTIDKSVLKVMETRCVLEHMELRGFAGMKRPVEFTYGNPDDWAYYRDRWSARRKLVDEGTINYFEAHNHRYVPLTDYSGNHYVTAAGSFAVRSQFDLVDGVPNAYWRFVADPIMPREVSDIAHERFTRVIAHEARLERLAKEHAEREVRHKARKAMWAVRRAALERDVQRKARQARSLLGLIGDPSAKELY